MDWGTVVGAGISSIAGLASLPIQHKYNKELMEIEQGYARENAAITQGYTQDNMRLQGSINNQLAGEAHKRNLQMYEQTQSAQAKIREMEAAGLSVGLMNGTPSAGGATSGGTASVSGAPGANVTTPKMNNLDIAGIVNGIGTNAASIAKTIKETEIADAQAEILKIEAGMKEKMTKAELDEIQARISNLFETTRGQRLDNDTKERLFETNIQIVQQQVQINTAELSLKEEQTKLLQEQINATISNVALAIKDFEWKKQNAIDEREFEERLTRECNNFKQKLQDDQQEWADTNREDEQDFKWLEGGYGLAGNAIGELVKMFGGKKGKKYGELVKRIFEYKKGK